MESQRRAMRDAWSVGLCRLVGCPSSSSCHSFFCDLASSEHCLSHRRTFSSLLSIRQTEWKKYQTYPISTDPDQDDKSTEIKLCSFARPHMRAFHCSWWGFFIAFFIWFAVAPLLSEIRTDLGLTKQEIWTSSIVGVGGTIMMRFILGPLCDKYGARILFTAVLCFASIPTACTGLVQTAGGLATLRLFIGFAGGTFVMCQYWSSRMVSCFDCLLVLVGYILALAVAVSHTQSPSTALVVIITVYQGSCGYCQCSLRWMGKPWWRRNSIGYGIPIISVVQEHL